jgi:hypothetical protein
MFLVCGNCGKEFDNRKPASEFLDEELLKCIVILRQIHKNPRGEDIDEYRKTLIRGRVLLEVAARILPQKMDEFVALRQIVDVRSTEIVELMQNDPFDIDERPAQTLAEGLKRMDRKFARLMPPQQ